MFWEVLALGLAFGAGAMIAETVGILVLTRMMKDED